MTHEIPSGDVLIHAGDFTNIGTFEEVKEFSDFMKSLNEKFKYKCVIAGNHELTFDPQACNRFMASNRIRKDKGFHTNQDPRELLTDCIYLEDTMVELFGLKIYGAPW
jgi:3',5'-cyclic AMP phosphodiesterase CpdA